MVELRGKCFEIKKILLLLEVILPMPLAMFNQNLLCIIQY